MFFLGVGLGFTFSFFVTRAAGLPSRLYGALAVIGLVGGGILFIAGFIEYHKERMRRLQ